MKGNSQKEDRNGKRKRRILLLILLLLLPGILFCMFFHRKDINSSVSSDPSNARGGIDLTIDPNAKNGHSQASERENIEEQSVVISGKGAITVSAGERGVYVDLYNPDKNEGLYYLTFELRLYDGSEQEYEVLYASGLVEPGKHIETITLSRALEKGVYSAVIHVQPYRMNEDKTPTNNADMKIQLIVK